MQIEGLHFRKLEVLLM